jgi:uncharacterized tellurite resistance protein B-like protein
MSLFEKFKTGKQPELTEAEAVFCIFMSVIYADGKMSDSEVNEFSFNFNKIKLFKGLTISNLFPEFQKLFKQFEFNPEKVVEMASPFVAANNHLPVFIYCCDFVYSDNTLKPSEERLLNKIMECLSLDEKLSENVLHIMQRKSQL